MGWNKQSGDAWVLQRTADKHTAAGEHDKVEKMLQLRVLSPLTIQDAHRLALAILDEVTAATQSEYGRCTNHRWDDTTHRCLICGTERQISYGSAVLQNWDLVLGPEPEERPGLQPLMVWVDEVLGVEVQPWQRKIIEQVMSQKQPPVNLEDDDGCPND